MQQRDNEISILVAMLKRRGAGQPSSAAEQGPAQLDSRATAATEPSTSGRDVASAQEALLDISVLKDRSKAFELFRRSYRKNQAIEDNKAASPFRCGV